MRGYQRKGGKGRVSADAGAVPVDAADYDPLTSGAEHSLSKAERSRQRQIAKAEQKWERKFPKMLHDTLGVGRDGVTSWSARYSHRDTYVVDAKLADGDHDLELRMHASRDEEERDLVPIRRKTDRLRPQSLRVRAQDRSGREHSGTIQLIHGGRKDYIAAVKSAREWSSEVQASDDWGAARENGEAPRPKPVRRW